MNNGVIFFHFFIATIELGSQLVHGVHHVLLDGCVLGILEVGHVGREPALNNLKW